MIGEFYKYNMINIRTNISIYKKIIEGDIGYLLLNNFPILIELLKKIIK